MGKRTLVTIMLIVLLMTVAGCSSLNRTEKLWLGAMIVSNTVDGTFLHNANEDDETSLKIGTVALFYVLGEIYPESRTTFYQMGTGVGVSSLAYNTFFEDNSKNGPPYTGPVVESEPYCIEPGF